MIFNSSRTTKIGMALALSFLLSYPALANDAVKRGEAVFQGTCIACHGEDGKGTIPGVPDFTKSGGRLTKPEAVLIDHITNGFSTPDINFAMPALGGNEDLTDQDVKDVLAYLEATFLPKK